jgi:hypothetical protein
MAGLKKLIAIAAMLSSPAVAFPENIRQGYSTCAGCHVNGAGSGILTMYGREKAASGLSTWASENEGGALGDLLPLEEYPEWLLVGGDIRYLATPETRFTMQASAEVALMPAENLTLAASSGVYGPERRHEYREYYARLGITEYGSIRIGRFLPVYGVLFDDHTLASRARLGFGEGQERYAAEASLRGGIGEIVATQTFGDSGSINLRGDDGIEYGTYDDAITAVRVAAYLGDRAQVGVSYKDDAKGAFALYAPNEWLYLMTDFNRMPDAVSTTVAGFEPLKGITVAATHEFADRKSLYGLQIRAYPRPHFGLLARVKHDGTSALVLHFYL